MPHSQPAVFAAPQELPPAVSAGGVAQHVKVGRLDYDVFMRLEGQTGWHFGVTCHSATTAWECQQMLRRDRPGALIKILSKPKCNGTS